MSLAGALAAVLLIATPVAGQIGLDCGVGGGGGCVDWSADGGGQGGNDWGRALAVSPSGRAVFVATNGADVAYDAGTGRPLWRAANGTAGGTGAQDIALDAAGAAVVSVGERSFPDPDRVVGAEIVTTAHDPATGRLLWQARHREPDGATASARHLAVTDRAVFVAGQRLETGEALVLAYDLGNGRPLWQASYGGEGTDGAVARPVDIVAAPDGGRVFLALSSREGGAYAQWVTVAYDAASGAALWVGRRSDGDHSALQATEMAVHPDGSLLYVTGWERRPQLSGGSFDFLTVAYDTARGTVRWAEGFAGPGAADDLAWSVAVAPDGGAVYVAGFSGGPAPAYWVEARGARRGEARWASSLPLSTPTQDDNGLFGFAQVRPSPDGARVYVTGAARDATAGEPGEGLASISVDALDAVGGRALWHGRFAGPGGVDASLPVAMAVDPGGSRLYVTGQSWRAGGGSVETVAFRTAGADLG